MNMKTFWRQNLNASLIDDQVCIIFSANSVTFYFILNLKIMHIYFKETYWYCIYLLFYFQVACDVELTTVYPKIFSIGDITNNDFLIVAENITLIKTNDFVKAVCLLLSFYYTMNISYPKELVSTLTFIQRYFLKIETCGNIPQKIFSLFSKLKTP